MYETDLVGTGTSCYRPGVSAAGNSGVVLLAGRNKLVPRGRFAQYSDGHINTLRTGDADLRF